MFSQELWETIQMHYGGLRDEAISSEVRWRRNVQGRQSSHRIQGEVWETGGRTRLQGGKRGGPGGVRRAWARSLASHPTYGTQGWTQGPGSSERKGKGDRPPGDPHIHQPPGGRVQKGRRRQAQETRGDPGTGAGREKGQFTKKGRSTESNIGK